MFKLYKHINNTDVAIQILKSFYIPEKKIYKLKVLWWNIGACHAPWCMGIEQKIIIKKEDMHKWKEYTKE